MGSFFEQARQNLRYPRKTSLEDERQAEIEKILAEISEMRDRPVEGREISSRGVLLAPDGTPSLLRSEFVWKFVRTPTFKKLFGDWESGSSTKVGKLLDDKGEPMLFVHGSSRDFFPLRRRGWIQKKFFRASANLSAEKKIDAVNFTGDAAMALSYGERLNFCFISAERLIRIDPPLSVGDAVYAEPSYVREMLQKHLASYKNFKKQRDNSAGVWDQELDNIRSRPISVLKVQDRRTIIPVPSPRLDKERLQEARAGGKKRSGISNISTVFPQIQITSEDTHELQQFVERLHPPFIVSKDNENALVSACLQRAKVALENGGDPMKDFTHYRKYSLPTHPPLHEYWPTSNVESYILENPSVSKWMEVFMDTTNERLRETDRGSDDATRLFSSLPSHFESAFNAAIKAGTFSIDRHHPFLQYVKEGLATCRVEPSQDEVEALETFRRDTLRPLLQRGADQAESIRLYKNIQIKAYQILRGSDQYTDAYSLE